MSYEHNEDPLRMALGVICLTIAALFASAGGIGGGGMLVPICMVVLDFDFSTSVILSLTTGKRSLEIWIRIYIIIILIISQGKVEWCIR